MSIDAISENKGLNTMGDGTRTDERFWRLEQFGEEPSGNNPMTAAPRNERLSSLTRMILGLEEKLLALEERFWRLEEQPDEELLPEVLDDITLCEITPKLPWTSLYILSSVSRTWQRAIRGPELYDARIRARSTETLVAIVTNRYSEYGLTLYSITGNRCFQLPLFPNRFDGHWDPFVNIFIKCISMDGQIYVMRSAKIRDAPDWVYVNNYSNDVYVFNIARQRKWKQCASMLQSRKKYGVGFLNGKIYVFGGIEGSILDGEVYDPKIDTWSQLKPTPRGRYHTTLVTARGDELFVYTVSNDYRDHVLSLFVDVYNPGKNEWRTATEFAEELGTSWTRYFIARGQFHSISRRGVQVFDLERNSWATLHSNLFEPSSPNYFDHEVEAVEHVGDEVLAVVHSGEENGRRIYIRSKGFGGENNMIVWQKANCFIPYTWPPCMCPIEL